MLGAIIGDIVGSRYEHQGDKTKDFEFFTDECFFTDDSVLTLAVAKALMETYKCSHYPSDLFFKVLGANSTRYLRKLGSLYQDRGFGGMFHNWLREDDPKPYFSWGNGAAMRVSPVGFIATDEEQVVNLSAAVTWVTHNHPEGIKGAEATAMAVYLARNGASKDDIKKRIETEYYALDFTIDEIRDSFEFDLSCWGTVPQAIEAFLESTSFEDAIRIAISLGGDSDTIGAITGGIAEAYYGIPKEMQLEAISYLTEDLLVIYREWLMSEFY
jgi:type I restriction enzyme M protein